MACLATRARRWTAPFSSANDLCMMMDVFFFMAYLDMTNDTFEFWGVGMGSRNFVMAIWGSIATGVKWEEKAT